MTSSNALMRAAGRSAPMDRASGSTEHGFRVFWGEGEAPPLLRSPAPLLQPPAPPPPAPCRLSPEELVGRWNATVAAKTGISERTRDDYQYTGAMLLEILGPTADVAALAPDQFEALHAAIAKRHTGSRFDREVNQARMIFKYAFDRGMIAVPLNYGGAFSKRSKCQRRKEEGKRKTAQGEKLLAATQILGVLSACREDPQMYAMVLLGINCAFGPGDCAALPRSACGLKTGWIDYPRPKTGVDRRLPLWPETVVALDLAQQARGIPKKAADRDLVFVTHFGHAWVQPGRQYPAAARLREAMKQAGCYRKGIGSYVLRHTFATIAAETRDQVAVNAIMGHETGGTDENYRHRIDDGRLRAVTEHVHRWLFGSQFRQRDLF